MAMTQAQIDAEIKRKALAGEALVGGGGKNPVVPRANSDAYMKYAMEKYNTPTPATTPTDPGPVQNGGGGGGGSSQSLIDQLNNARLNNTLAALGKSRDAALSNLQSEKGAIQPKYYDQRNQVASGAQQQARNFSEYMAARGGTSSGANAQAELSRNMTTQGNLGTLGRQEAQAYTDIERRTSDLQNAYQSDVASATSGVEADRMQAMLSDYYNNQQRDLQLAGLMGVYNGQQTLGGRSADLAQNQFNYGKQTDQRDFNYGAGRDKVTDNQWQQGFDYTKELNKRDFDYQVGRDDVVDTQWAQGFAETVKQNGIQNALAQVKASSSGGSGGTKDLSLAQKISIWKISGQAPEGIPGVVPGTMVYDEVAARNAAEKSGGVKLWDAIKGVISTVSKAGASVSGASDADISSYLNK